MKQFSLFVKELFVVERSVLPRVRFSSLFICMVNACRHHDGELSCTSLLPSLSCLECSSIILLHFHTSSKYNIFVMHVQ